MPRDPNIRERRREAILELLTEGEVIREQKDLVERLRALGFEATQSSISRDFRDLGIVRINGYYDLPLKTERGEITDELSRYIEAGVPVTPNITLFQVTRGTSVLVSRIITEAELPEVGGTMASLDDKVLVFTRNLNDQARLFLRFNVFMQPIDGKEMKFPESIVVAALPPRK
jgi:transcriptional regulator of arginine metabolism